MKSRTDPNPYIAPDSPLDSSGETNSGDGPSRPVRRPWLAALLGLLVGGLGYLYVGRPLLACLAPLLMIAVVAVLGHGGVMFTSLEPLLVTAHL